MTRLLHKRALITGGSTGIGAATARRFVSEGATVAILDTNEEAAAQLIAGFNTDGGSATFHRCDVRDHEAVGAAVAGAVAALGGLDIVFANAAVGTIHVGGTIETIEPERWDLAIEVDLGGVYSVCRHAIPHLRAAGGGSVVITSSSSAFVASAGRPTHAYAAAKGALLSLVRAMAVSYGHDNIRVNALAPGFVRTRLTEDIAADPERLRAALAGIPLGRHGEPDEMAACVAFLASDDASFVTGTVLVADGGQTIM